MEKILSKNEVITSKFFINWSGLLLTETIWLIFPFTFLADKWSDLGLGTVWVIHLLSQQNQTVFFVWSLNNVEHFVNNLSCSFISLDIVAICMGTDLGQIFWPNDPLNPQLNEIVDIWLSQCKVLDQAKVYIVVSFEVIEFLIHVVRVNLEPRRLP